MRVADTITSPDSRHVASVEQRSSGESRTFDIAIDGVPGPGVQWIVGQSLLFSPDSSRISWQTQESLIAVVVDSVEHLLHAGAAGDAGPATVGKGYWMAGHVLFSKDGRHAAFPAQLEKADKPQWRMIVDGKAGDAFDTLDDSQMLFSPDGSRLAYKAVQADRQFFVVDGVPGPHYDGVVAPVFSDNGARFAYLAKQADQEFYVIDGREGPHYELAAAFCFAPGGKRYAYAAGKAGKQLLVVDGKAYKPFDGIGDLLFSPDGRRIALTAISGPRWIAVIDGKESGAMTALALHFSPDSKRLAFVAGRGRQQLAIVDGKEGPVLDGVGSLTFSPDSRQIGYLAINGAAQVLVVDGQTIGPAGTSYAFSPDGRHVARIVPRTDGHCGLAIDGTEANVVYDGFPLGSRIVWDSPDTAHTIAGRANELMRVELHVP